ncbi:hypothetical protein NW767_015597 [Fusarium falciforme]|nr:hypothetical protein NW767_015597 [Fusarium falciforme]
MKSHREGFCPAQAFCTRRPDMNLMADSSTLPLHHRFVLSDNMDPASLAFGVVSLAMQLVQTTSAIRKLIGAYKSAAKELTAMSDKLDDIETICHSLEIILDNFEAAPRSWETSLLLKLHKTIDGCRGKASQIHDVIIKVVSRHNERRNPLNTLGALFLQHRDQLRQCNDELDQSLRSLQLHMTTNILQVPSNLMQWS